MPKGIPNSRMNPPTATIAPTADEIASSEEAERQAANAAAQNDTQDDIPSADDILVQAGLAPASNGPEQGTAGTFPDDVQPHPAVPVPATYTTKQDETFGDVAEKFGVTHTDLHKANPTVNTHCVLVDTVLTIPVK